MATVHSPKDASAAAELQALFAKRPSEMKPGLARMRAALPFLPEGALATPSVLIGGTNGKGTTTGYLFRLLTAAGLRTGIFTSPHLVHFAERIQASRGTEPRLAPWRDADLVQALRILRERLPQPIYEAMSFFEVNTLLALAVFFDAHTDINLLEVGLGGRFDSTNAIDPSVAVVTSIGLDHQEFLGNTLAAIAAEKAGILRPKIPVVFGALEGIGPEADGVLVAKAQELGALVARAGTAARVNSTRDTLFIEAAPFGPTTPGAVRRLAAGSLELPAPAELALAPDFLAHNFAAAALAFLGVARIPRIAGRFRVLGHESGPEALAAALRGFSASPVPPSMMARFSRILVPPEAPGVRGQKVEVLFDVGHNPHAAKALVAALAPLAAANGGKLPGVVSILADKDHAQVLDQLRQVLSPLHLFPLPAERTWRREDLASRHQDLTWHASLADAWEAALRTKHRPIVAAGSVQGLGHMMTFLGIDPLLFGALK